MQIGEELTSRCLPELGDNRCCDANATNVTCQGATPWEDRYRDPGGVQVKWAARASRPTTTLGLLLAPVVVAVVYRVALFQLPGLDASAHTSYIVDPRAMFARYQAALSPTGRMREGARVGMLVPARLAYLAFGAVPGFLVVRYVLALVAIVPAYLLFRRCYGMTGGVLVVLAILTSPVVLASSGTDYPVASSLPYLICALATLCLAADIEGRSRRPPWLLVAGAATAMATWSLAECGIYGAGFVVAFVAVGLYRKRPGVLRDVVAIAVGAVIATAALLIGSGLLLGQYDFIGPTLHATAYLSKPSQELLWHSRSWHWLPYCTYLLALPGLLVAAAVTAGRRPLSQMTTTNLVIVGACALQLLAATWLQFGGGAETLEAPYWSATLWPAAILAGAVACCELARPLRDRERWLAPAVVAVVPLVFELGPHLPALTWFPGGLLLLAVIVIVTVATGRVLRRRTDSPPRRGLATTMAVVGLVVLTGGVLAVEVAPTRPHARPAATIAYPPPQYADTLGSGGNPTAVDWYRVTTAVPAAVGPVPHIGDQLLMWFPRDELQGFRGPAGLFHGLYDSVRGSFPQLSRVGRNDILRRHPGQIVLMGDSASGFPRAIHSLSPFGPTLARQRLLRSGDAHLAVWVVDLRWPGSSR